MTSTINENCYYSKGLSMTDYTCKNGHTMCIGCSGFIPKKGIKGFFKRLEKYFNSADDNTENNMNDVDKDFFDSLW